MRRAVPARFSPVLRGAAVLAALAALVIAPVVASTVALPGEPLYGVKLTVEQLHRLLVTDPAARAALDRASQEERLKEVRLLMQRGQSAHVDVMGVLEATGPGVWSVGGLVVPVNSGTRIVGDAQLGALVRIIGRVQDGTLTVDQIMVLGEGAALPTPAATPSMTETPEQTATPSPNSSRMPTLTRTPMSVATDTPQTKPTDDLSPGGTPEHKDTATPEPTEGSESGDSSTPESDH